MAKAAPEIPNKLFYKIGEVCEITDTQPYVLRFWESEFPQLAPRKNRSGQRVYQRKDIETVVRIKKLLYEEEYTIAGARRKLEEDPVGDEAEISRATEEAVAAAAPRAERKAEEPASSRSRRASAEHDHPVDALSARIEKQSGRGKEPPPGDPDREARLEKALAELKKQMKEVLAVLSKE